MKYRGYYIDHVVFNSREEIDERIKQDNIKKLKQFNRLMETYTDKGMIMSACREACRIERVLHDECGMTWDAIEEIA